MASPPSVSFGLQEHLHGDTLLRSGKRAEIQTSLAEKLLTVRANPLPLRMVVLNLIINADEVAGN